MYHGIPSAQKPGGMKATAIEKTPNLGQLKFAVRIAGTETTPEGSAVTVR